MSAIECIVSAQHNRPVVGLTQDAMTAVYLMTKPGVFVSRGDFQQFVYKAGLDHKVESLMKRIPRHRKPAVEAQIQYAIKSRIDTIFHPPTRPDGRLLNPETESDRRLRSRYEAAARALVEEYATPLDDEEQKENPVDLEVAIELVIEKEVRDEYYVTGKELFSILLPDDYIYSKHNKADPLEPVVRIVEGILETGTVDKAIAGATHNSIIHDLYKMYSPSHAEDFISRGKWLADAWFRKSGFTVSLQDCTPLPPRANQEAFAAVSNRSVEQARIAAWEAGPRSSNPLEEIKRQELIREALCRVKDTVGILALQRVDQGNSIKTMIESGSKGSKANFASILGPVGPQELQGQPIQPLPGGRTIPCYERNTRDPTAGGFVASSYLKGLTPQESFFHQAAAREGLLGTATKTAETGYIQRRIVKALEDAVAMPDGSVRNSSGNLIQYAYGEDGFAGEKLVLSDGKSRFIDIRKLVGIVKGRRAANLEPMFKPYKPSERRYLMPSFDGEPVEEEEEEEKKEEEEEEEGDEGADASDLEDDIDDIGGGDD